MNTITRRLLYFGVGILTVVACLSLAAPQLWYPLWFDQGAFAACADALRRGVWVAGRCVASAGDWEGLPTRAGLSHMRPASDPELLRN